MPNGWFDYVATLFTWASGKAVSDEEAKRCAKRDPGRSWEAIESEMVAIGESAAGGGRGRGLGVCEARTGAAGEKEPSERELRGRCHVSLTEHGPSSLPPAAGVHPNAWPLPLTLEGVQAAEKNPVPQPVPVMPSAPKPAAGEGAPGVTPGTGGVAGSGRGRRSKAGTFDLETANELDLWAHIVDALAAALKKQGTAPPSVEGQLATLKADAQGKLAMLLGGVNMNMFQVCAPPFFPPLGAGARAGVGFVGAGRGRILPPRSSLSQGSLNPMERGR